MAKKKLETKRETENPVGYPIGTILEELFDGTTIKTNPDGTKERIGKDGKIISGLIIKSEQIEAWKKIPREQATKEIIELINNSELDVAEKRFNLDAIWKLAELNGATTQTQPQNTQVMVVEIIMPGQNSSKHLIEVTPQKVQSHDPVL